MSDQTTNDEQAPYGTIEADGTLVTSDGVRWKRASGEGLNGEYVREQPKLEPLLPTEENLGFKYDLNDPHVDISSASSELASSFALWFGDDVRDWHPEEIAEAVLRFGITSGELMVVKTCKFVTNNYDANIDCDGCGWSICYIHVEDNPMKFCPGCGAKIVEP